MFVDCRGRQFELSPPAVSAAFADPFAPGHAALLTRLNAAPDAAATFRELCAVFLGVPVDEAHMMQAREPGRTSHPPRPPALRQLTAGAAPSAHPGAPP